LSRFRHRFAGFLGGRPERFATRAVGDDQVMVRAGFRLTLTARGIEVVGQAGDGAKTVEAVRRLQPDVVLAYGTGLVAPGESTQSANPDH
jgi:DNA-binding NarL/FixJ family response regulator